LIVGLETQRLTRATGVTPHRAELLTALARVLDYSSVPAVSHHGRVAVLAARVAAHLPHVDPRSTFYAGLVHDIGTATADVDPTWSCSLEQQANHPVIRAHPFVGAQTMAAVPGLFDVAQIILDHHEWANGHGYPRGKTADEIPLASQAIRFADTCDMLLREQSSPELVAFVHAVLGRVSPQVTSMVADAGLEVLGELNLYTQLLVPEDVDLLAEGTIRRYAADDLVTSESDISSLLEIFGDIADSRPSDKTGHSRRVANLAVLVAMAMGQAGPEITVLKWASLVHDVGLVAVPRTLLDKPGMLTPAELTEIRGHVTLVDEFIRPVSGLEEVAKVAGAYGEAWDGSGYPRGLSGQDIPLASRILAVCDTFDALTSRRPYREARDVSLAVDILVKGSGSVFDPTVVAAAVPVFLIALAAEDR